MILQKAIAKEQDKLINKVRTKGLYENFGRNEVRKINEKYDAYEIGDDGVKNYVKMQEFSDWASGFDGTRYEKGGEVKKKENNEMIIGGLAGILLGIFLNK